MLKSLKRLKKINKRIKTTLEEDKWKLKANSFIRERKMNMEDIIKSIIFKKGQTLSIELDEFTERMGKERITKQGYSKQRQNLNPEIFNYLNEEYIKDIYNEIEVKRYKGYILISVDGSMIELPNSNELKEYYGLAEGQKGSVGRVRARAIGVYDSLNKIMVKTKLDPYKTNEKEQIEKLLDEIIEFYKEEKIIMVFDRFYFGVNFINKLEKREIKYLIRMRENVYKKEKELMKSEDEEVELKIRTNSIHYAKEEEREELKKLKQIKARIIKVQLDSGIEEHLCTNMNEEEMTKEEAKELYFTRWNIEKSFDVIKNKINIENFSSKKVIGIEQEFYAQMMVYNMLEDIRRDAEEELEQNKKELKYEYKINMNILAGKFKKEFLEIFEEEDMKELDKKYEKMIEEMRKNVIPIKPNRKFERRKMHSMNKYRSNLRRNV